LQQVGAMNGRARVKALRRAAVARGDMNLESGAQQRFDRRASDESGSTGDEDPRRAWDWIRH
jgi:hypothetical protein